MADVPSEGGTHPGFSVREEADPKAVALHVDDLSSDDEAPRNTIGNVPLEWYEHYDHIGYNLAGEKLEKKPQKDRIQKFLDSMDDPMFRWTVRDEENDEDIVLSRREVEIIRQIHSAKYPHKEFNPHPEYIPYYSSIPEKLPLSSAPEPKRRFLPSKWEKMKIMRLVKLIREGKYHRGPPPKAAESYLLWGDDDTAIGYTARRRAPLHIPAPKLPPPGHNASYNPPPEYLMTEEEEKRWHTLHPDDRPVPFIPRKFKALRHVPVYANGIREVYDRCLDLYLAPRAMRKKLQIDPESLLPKLPDPKELRPFPTTPAVRYMGHTGRMRSLSVDPTGQWLVTGSDDSSIRLWEVTTGRQMHKWDTDGVVQCVAWNPNPALHVVAAVVNTKLLLLSTATAGPEHVQPTFDLLSGAAAEADRRKLVAVDKDEEEDGASAGAGAGAGAGAAAGDDAPTKKKDLVSWAWVAPEALTASTVSSLPAVAVEVTTHAQLKRVEWHRKGDYLSTVSPTAPHAHVLVHQASRRKSQVPFRRSHGLPQCVVFHPVQPVMFVANQRTVRVFHLTEERLVKKLETGLKYVSTMAVHPGGEHVVVGGYDCRVAWIDWELAATPFKTLRYHDKAVRRVSLHRSYPLLASAADDGRVHVFHARVFDDYNQNPMIVPVRILKASAVTKDDLGCLDCVFHPTQPWVFTASATGSATLFQSIGV